MNFNRDTDQPILLTKKENITYTLNFNQEQLEILYELCSFVGGIGPVRNFTDKLSVTLEAYANSSFLETKYFSEDSLIKIKESK